MEGPLIQKYIISEVSTDNRFFCRVVAITSRGPTDTKRKCYFPSEPDGHLERSCAIFRLPVIALKTGGRVWVGARPLPRIKIIILKIKIRVV